MGRDGATKIMAKRVPKTASQILRQNDLETRRRIEVSISELVMDSRFVDFMQEIGSLREMSLETLEEVEIIKSERATLAVVSQASALKKIYNIYEDKRSEMMARAQLEKEQRDAQAALEAEQNQQAQA